jgi:hypothetical protein
VSIKKETLHWLKGQEVILINWLLKNQEKFGHFTPPPKAGKTNLL